MNNKLANIFSFAALFISSLSFAEPHVTYYTNDASGTPIVETDMTGAVKARAVHTPYGESDVAHSTTDTSNHIGYTGHIEDPNGLVYAMARYYDPLTGRFLSQDPKGFNERTPWSFNRYLYAKNNPYRYLDPDGRDEEQVKAVYNAIKQNAPAGFNIPPIGEHKDLGKGPNGEARNGDLSVLNSITNKGMTLDEHFYSEHLDVGGIVSLIGAIGHESVHDNQNILIHAGEAVGDAIAPLVPQNISEYFLHPGVDDQFRSVVDSNPKLQKSLSTIITKTMKEQSKKNDAK